LLSDALIQEGPAQRSQAAILIPSVSIAYIELPPTRWQARSPTAPERPITVPS
jgi:hypothetical protein